MLWGANTPLASCIRAKGVLFWDKEISYADLHIFIPDFPLATIPNNGMDAHFLKRHLSAKVLVALLPLNIERGIRNEDYYDRH